MKKIASLILSLVMVLGLAAPALADDNTLGNEAMNSAGDVVRTGKSTVSYEGVTPHWTVTVPASITAGAETADNVTVSGEFDETQTVTVTADATVTLSDANGTTVNADVTFGADHTFVVRGNSTAAVNQSQTISVAKPNVLFGSWSGTLNYTATSHQAVVTSISAEWTNSGRVREGAAVDKDSIKVTATYDNDSQMTLPSSKFTVSPETWAADTEIITITLVGNTSMTCTLAPTSITQLVKNWQITASDSVVTTADGYSSNWEGFVYSYKNNIYNISENVTVTLNVDIDVTGKSLSPLGTATRPFKGTFDGSGHKIKGLSASLFDCLGDGATVRAVTFNDADITGAETLFGDVVGTNVKICNYVVVADSSLTSLFGNVTGSVSFDDNCEIESSSFSSTNPVASSGAEYVDYSYLAIVNVSGWTSE